jgi:transposase
MFVCRKCSWRCDRQINAGLNIERNALAELPLGARTPGLGGLVLAPDAMARDRMTLLYPRVAPGSQGGRDGQGGSRSRTRERSRL